MRHPNQATLALYAGGDLGSFTGWRTERHLVRCPQCRDEVAGFEALREIVPELAQTPEISWNRLAAEMKANIRLGLAAGECVKSAPEPSRFFGGARAAVAFASAVALVATGLVLEHPAPVAATQGIVLQTTANGIQVREGGQALRFLHSGTESKDVTYTPSAEGSYSARYRDSETGLMTVTTVYAD